MVSTAKRSSLRVVRDAYEAFNRGDPDGALALMADDIEWVEPEGSVDGGTYRGPDEVMEDLFAPAFEAFEKFRVDVDRYLDVGDEVVVVGSFRGRTRSGDSFDIPCAHLVGVEDGRITRFRNFTDTARWNEAYEG